MKNLVIAAMMALTSAAWAQTTVKVEDAWVRGTVAQQQATGAFMRLTASQNARLVEASSPVAGVTEVHEMAMDNDVMRMRQIQGLPLAAGQTVELKPGGFHVMLMNLKQTLQAGQNVPVTTAPPGVGESCITTPVLPRYASYLPGGSPTMNSTVAAMPPAAAVPRPIHEMVCISSISDLSRPASVR